MEGDPQEEPVEYGDLIPSPQEHICTTSYKTCQELCNRW